MKGVHYFSTDGTNYFFEEGTWYEQNTQGVFKKLDPASLIEADWAETQLSLYQEGSLNESDLLDRSDHFKNEDDAPDYGYLFFKNDSNRLMRSSLLELKLHPIKD